MINQKYYKVACCLHCFLDPQIKCLNLKNSVILYQYDINYFYNDSKIMLSSFSWMLSALVWLPHELYDMTMFRAIPTMALCI